MSEYQFIHFLAIDQPLDEEQLDFMRRQSSRAKITEWEFSNEYHFGDFSGNAREMLRRGYEAHLHYANFGIRRLMFRLPHGLPCERKRFEAFLPDGGITWHADKIARRPARAAARPKRDTALKGPGILEISPEADAGSYDEDVRNPVPLLRKLVPVRDMLMDGDLRPLYLAWLACNDDEEAIEPPVPPGLRRLTPSLKAMAAFYEISPALIAAAAEQSPPLPGGEKETLFMGMIARAPEADLRKLMDQVRCPHATRIALPESKADLRETLELAVTSTWIVTEGAGAGQEAPFAWPMGKPTRTLGQLRALAADFERRRVGRKQKAADAARRKRLEDIAADPRPLIANVAKLVNERSAASYEQAAQQLADLREALGPDAGPTRAQAVANRIRRKNPTRRQLISVLRRHGLLG